MSQDFRNGLTLQFVSRKSVNTVETTYKLEGYEDSFTVIWTNFDHFGDEQILNKYHPQEWVQSDDNKLACLISNIIHDGLDCQKPNLFLYMKMIEDFTKLQLDNYAAGLYVRQAQIDDFGQYALLSDLDGNEYCVSMVLPECIADSMHFKAIINDQPADASKFHARVYDLARDYVYHLYAGENNDPVLSQLSFAHGSKIKSYRKALPSDATSFESDWEEITHYLNENSVLVGFDEYGEKSLFELSEFNSESCYIETQLDDFYLSRCSASLDSVLDAVDRW